MQINKNNLAYIMQLNIPFTVIDDHKIEVHTKRTQPQIMQDIAQLKDGIKGSKLNQDLSNLCDAKSIEAKAYINGAKVSVELLARYEGKLLLAQTYASQDEGKAQKIGFTLAEIKSLFTLEANFNNLTVEQLADMIILKGTAYKKALKVFNTRIEAFRVAVSKLIDNKEFNKAQKVLDKAQEFGATTTDDEVLALLTDTTND